MLKVCIVHGSPRKKGSTAKAVSLFKEKLQEYGDIEFIEYYLPKAMPEFCKGCFNCFFNGEENCPDAKYMQPIVKSFEEVDGIILTTPVYALAESAQIKAFLDHLAYMFIVHRPNVKIMNTVGAVVSTTVGAGTGHATKTIARSMKYWGLKKVTRVGIALYSDIYEKAPLSRRKKAERKVDRNAKRFYKLMSKRQQLPKRLHTFFVMRMIKMMLSSEDNNSLDKKYWVEQGWL